VLAQLIRHGRVRRARLGLGGQKMAIPRRLVRAHGLAQSSGVLVSEVEENGPAARAGVRAGDILVKLDEAAVTGIDELLRLLTEGRLDRHTKLVVIRDGALVELEALLVERR
jgi:S1-C subfamily serine protease